MADILTPDASLAGSDGSHFQLLEFFARACPHCVHMEPVWGAAKAAATEHNLTPGVEWVQKECYGDGWAKGKDFDFCDSHGVHQFPTLVLVKDNGDTWQAPPLSGDSVSDKANSLVSFVKSHLPGSNSDLYTSSLGISSIVCSLFFGNKQFYDFL